MAPALFITRELKGNDTLIRNDLTGKTFGRLTALEPNGKSNDGKTKWLCQCACGNRVTVVGSCLTTGHTRSCGCLSREEHGGNIVDRVGERYGRLLVIRRADDYVSPKGVRHVRWLCQCDCGNTTVVDTGLLRNGETRSCGCLHLEKLAAGNVKHGGCRDRLYGVYANMKRRCYNESSTDYKYYGGRGITICDEWLDDYLSFKSWAYSHGYDEHAPRGQCTIDRIDVNRGYEPDNCRWVSMAVQSRNRRNVINSNTHD